MRSLVFVAVTVVTMFCGRIAGVHSPKRVWGCAGKEGNKAQRRGPVKENQDYSFVLFLVRLTTRPSCGKFCNQTRSRGRLLSTPAAGYLLRRVRGGGGGGEEEFDWNLEGAVQFLSRRDQHAVAQRQPGATMGCDDCHAAVCKCKEALRSRLRTLCQRACFLCRMSLLGQKSVLTSTQHTYLLTRTRGLHQIGALWLACLASTSDVACLQTSGTPGHISAVVVAVHSPQGRWQGQCYLCCALPSLQSPTCASSGSTQGLSLPCCTSADTCDNLRTRGRTPCALAIDPASVYGMRCRCGSGREGFPSPGTPAQACPRCHLPNIVSFSKSMVSCHAHLR